MSRFFGTIGYETPGSLVDDVWVASVVERDYYGDEMRAARSLEPGAKVNDDIRLQNQYSIMADAYALQHYSWIKYLVIDGVRWTVTSVEVRRPRLILSLGGVYSGQNQTP